jgi:sugar lactone lactonase YvrE
VPLTCRQVLLLGLLAGACGRLGYDPLVSDPPLDGLDAGFGTDARDGSPGGAVVSDSAIPADATARDAPTALEVGVGADTPPAADVRPAQDASPAPDTPPALAPDASPDTNGLGREVVTLAGPRGGAGWVDGAPGLARLVRPVGLTVATDGTILFTDGNDLVRAVTGAGTPSAAVTTRAGDGERGLREGDAAQARFSGPAGIVLDAAGDLLVADGGNQRVRRLRAGQVATLAGGAVGFVDGDGGAARFGELRGLAWHPDNWLVVVDAGNRALRRVLPDGTTSTLVGGPSEPTFADGPLASARLHIPDTVVVDATRRLVFTDRPAHRIRRVDATTVSTIAGSSEGLTNAAAAMARFRFPAGLALGNDGTIYVADRRNHVIRAISPAGAVSTLAGTGRPGAGDGPATSATFNHPYGLWLDGTDALYVADEGNHRIRRVQLASRVVDTVVGHGESGTVDGAPAVARFAEPRGLVVDRAGRLFIADALSHMIRVIDPDGTVRTHAGNGTRSLVNAGRLQSAFNEPTGLLITRAGELLVVDKENGRIRLVGDTAVTTLNDGPALNDPVDIVETQDGGLLITESEAFVIQRLDRATRTVTRFAGGPRGFADGPAAMARFGEVTGMVIDGSGNVYIADTTNHAIRRLDPAGNVTTFAGTGTRGRADGPRTTATFDEPRALALSPTGDLFVADRARLRRIDAAGTVSTIAGGSYLGSDDGIGPAAGFVAPGGLAFLPDGSLAVADTGNHAIRRIRLP